MCASARPGARRKRRRQLVEGLLGMIAPGELCQIVVAQWIVGVLFDVPGQFLQPFRQAGAGVPVDQRAVAARRIVSGPEAEILVVRDGGVPVVFAGLGGVGKRQRNLGSSGGQLFGVGQKIDGAGVVVKRGIHFCKLQQRVHMVWLKLEGNLQSTQGAVVVPGASRGAAQVEQDIEIVGLLHENGVEGRLGPVIGSDSGAGQSVEEAQTRVGGSLFPQTVQHGQRRGLLARPVQRLGAQQTSGGLRIGDARQVLERPSALVLVRGDARQLEIGVGVLGVQFEDTLEIRAGLFHVAAQDVMVAQVIQERQRRRSLRQCLLIEALRLAALVRRVQPGGLAESAVLRFRPLREHQRQKPNGGDVF